MGNILHQLEREEDDANLVYLRSEAERLRLTDEEREAIERLEDHCAKTHCVDTARVLRGLLARHGTIGHQE